MRKAECTFHKRKMAMAALLALLFTVLQITGYQISMFYQTTVHQSDFFQKIGVLSTAQVIGLGLIELPLWWVLLGGLFSVLDRAKAKETAYDSGGQLMWQLVVAVLLFCCWIPCLCAGYPGFYNYDVFNQVPQVLYEEVPYSAHHPLLHTLLMGNIISLGYRLWGTLNAGILLHSLFQMVVCAVAFSYLVCYVVKRTGRRWLGVLAFCYYGFFPPIALFAMSTTKDVIFSVLLQLWVVFVYEMFRDMQAFWDSRRKVVVFVITAVLMCLFRKNGIYIVVAMVPFAVLMWRNYRKQCVLILAASACLYLVISKGIVWMLHAREGSSEEALSVPMQQIARVYWEYGEEAFEQDELALIYDGISADQLMNYNPFLSDNIKNYFAYEVVEEQPGDYLKLWLEKGIQYPKEYIRAFLDNTYQAWYPGTSICDVPYTSATYYFDMQMHAGGERDSKAPGLLVFYENISTGYYYQQLPVVRLIFSIGSMFWVALFTMWYGIYRRNKPLIMAMLPVLLCCATVFLGPISLVRYYLILFYGFPVSIGFLLASESDRIISASDT